MRIFAAVCLVITMVLPLRAEPLTVFAAASLKNAFDLIADRFTEETGIDVVISYAGTSALARQIEQAAPADIFASANVAWTDHLVEGGALEPRSTRVFAGNELVLIAPVSLLLDAPPDLTSANDLLAVLGNDGRLAVALIDAVPAGLYAREAMQSLGTWEALEPRLAQTDNVRAALFLVARGEAPLGIVYNSDAEAEPGVYAVARFPAASHSPIRYTASRVAYSDSSLASEFLAYLTGADAQQILEDQGFDPAR